MRQAAAAALREQWSALDAYVASVPPLPAPPAAGGATLPSLQADPLRLGALLRAVHVPRLGACAAAAAKAAGVSVSSRAALSLTPSPCTTRTLFL